LLSARDNQRNQEQHQQLIEDNNRLHQHLSELSFHHDELRSVHQHVLGDNEQLRVTMSNIEQYCDDLQRRCEAIEADYKRKNSHLEQDLNDYKKREDLYHREMDSLHEQLSNRQASSSISYSGSPNEFTEELMALRSEIDSLNRQLTLEKDLHSNLSKKYE
jgi:chromosome segregation ATPase